MEYLYRHGHGVTGSDGAKASLLHQLALRVLVGDTRGHPHAAAPRARRPAGSLGDALPSHFLPG